MAAAHLKNKSLLRFKNLVGLATVFFLMVDAGNCKKQLQVRLPHELRHGHRLIAQMLSVILFISSGRLWL